MEIGRERGFRQEREKQPEERTQRPLKNAARVGTLVPWKETAQGKDPSTFRENSQGKDPSTFEGRGHKAERWRVEKKRKRSGRRGRR